MTHDSPIRVLVAKPGLDGHDRGAKVVAQALRDAGMEVLYTGLHKTVEEIAQTALDEDVDVIGLSILSGAHQSVSEKLIERLQELGVEDTMIVVGGNIPASDRPQLLEAGVDGVFPTRTDLDEIVEFIRQGVKKGQGTQGGNDG